MTVYDFARKCMADEEFNRGGIVKNERRYIDSVGFSYTVKDGYVYESGDDLRRFYNAMYTLLSLQQKYSK